MKVFQLRHLIVSNVLSTMGMDYVQNGWDFIVQDGLIIYLPEGDDTSVIMDFCEEIDPGMAAEFAMQFSRKLEKAGLEVVALPSFNCEDDDYEIDMIDIG